MHIINNSQLFNACFSYVEFLPVPLTLHTYCTRTYRFAALQLVDSEEERAALLEVVQTQLVDELLLAEGSRAARESALASASASSRTGAASRPRESPASKSPSGKRAGELQRDRGLFDYAELVSDSDRAPGVSGGVGGGRNRERETADAQSVESGATDDVELVSRGLGGTAFTRDSLSDTVIERAFNARLARERQLAAAASAAATGSTSAAAARESARRDSSSSDGDLVMSESLRRKIEQRAGRPLDRLETGGHTALFGFGSAARGTSSNTGTGALSAAAAAASASAGGSSSQTLDSFIKALILRVLARLKRSTGEDLDATLLHEILRLVVDECRRYTARFSTSPALGGLSAASTSAASAGALPHMMHDSFASFFYSDLSSVLRDTLATKYLGITLVIAFSLNCLIFSMYSYVCHCILICSEYRNDPILQFLKVSL